jgi:hypothetical protein
MSNDTMVSQVSSTEPDVCDCCGGPRDKARLVIGPRACPCTRVYDYIMIAVGPNNPAFVYGANPYGQPFCRYRACHHCPTHCSCVRGDALREAGRRAEIEAEQSWEQLEKQLGHAPGLADILRWMFRLGSIGKHVGT